MVKVMNRKTALILAVTLEVCSMAFCLVELIWVIIPLASALWVAPLILAIQAVAVVIVARSKKLSDNNLKVKTE